MTWTTLKRRIAECRTGLEYTLFARRPHFMASSRYMNMGYWASTPPTLDEACQAMAGLTGEVGRFGTGDRILDVGFGFAEQDFFWMERFAPRRIEGLDVARFQVREARKRVAERALDDRIYLRRGSATSMPFADDTFDKVVSLEAAFHFVTREDFFGEAFRVLRPGGRLVVTDMIPRAEGAHSLRRVSPLANLYPRDVYAKKLEKAGFDAVEVRSIREQVCLPYCDHLARRLQDPEAMKSLPLLSRRMLIAAADQELYAGLDYVIASAEKRAPGSRDCGAGAAESEGGR